MNALESIFLQYAVWLLRKERGEWADAMQSEFQHVSECERLSWAFGCVIAAIKQRWTPMNTGDFRISRWVMLIETLGCFGPLALSWYLLVFDQPGIIRWSFADVERWLLPQVGGAFIASMLYSGAVAGLIGPFGLFLGLRYVIFGRALDNKVFGASLIGALVVLMLVGWIGGIFFGPPDWGATPDAIFAFGCLPIVAIAHLMYLARPVTRPPALATA